MTASGLGVFLREHCGEDGTVDVATGLDHRDSLAGEAVALLQCRSEGRGAGPMHGGTHRHFEGFQIHAASFMARLEHHTQQLLYFTRDFLADRLIRFFSSGDRASSSGRARQILSFTSSNS